MQKKVFFFFFLLRRKKESMYCIYERNGRRGRDFNLVGSNSRQKDRELKHRRKNTVK